MQHSEFTVHVDGIGYVSGKTEPPFIVTVGAGEPDVFTDEDEVYTLASRVAEQYKRLGIPHIADGVRVRARTVTVTREAWREPIAIATVNGA